MRHLFITCMIKEVYIYILLRLASQNRGGATSSASTNRPPLLQTVMISYLSTQMHSQTDLLVYYLISEYGNIFLLTSTVWVSNNSIPTIWLAITLILVFQQECKKGTSEQKKYSHRTGFVFPLNCSTAVLTAPPPSSWSLAGGVVGFGVRGGEEHCVSIS